MLLKTKTHLLPIGLAASIALLLSSTSAKAALSYTDGDIFIGFRVAGAAQDSLLVDLGSYTQFLNPASSTLTFGTGTLGQDLTTLYGANWADRTDLSWSIFGTYSSDGTSLLASRSRSNLDVQSTPWPSISLANRNLTGTAIVTVENGFAGTGFSGTSTTDITTANAGRQVGTGVNSYYAAVNPANDFGRWNSIEGSNASGIDNTRLDLFIVSDAGNTELLPGTSPGSFTIGSSGTVTFEAFAPVPEPGTAGFAGACLLGLMAVRRRHAQAAVA